MATVCELLSDERAPRQIAKMLETKKSENGGEQDAPGENQRSGARNCKNWQENEQYEKLYRGKTCQIEEKRKEIDKLELSVATLVQTYKDLEGLVEDTFRKLWKHNFSVDHQQKEEEEQGQERGKPRFRSWLFIGEWKIPLASTQDENSHSVPRWEWRSRSRKYRGDSEKLVKLLDDSGIDFRKAKTTTDGFKIFLTRAKDHYKLMERIRMVNGNFKPSSYFKKRIFTKWHQAMLKARTLPKSKKKYKNNVHYPYTWWRWKFPAGCESRAEKTVTRIWLQVPEVQTHPERMYFLREILHYTKNC